jgi:hypothetical protein
MGMPSGIPVRNRDRLPSLGDGTGKPMLSARLGVTRHGPVAPNALSPDMASSAGSGWAAGAEVLSLQFREQDDVLRLAALVLSLAGDRAFVIRIDGVRR